MVLSSGFKSIAGIRKASVIDALTLKQGRDFKSTLETALAVGNQGWTPKGVIMTTFERFTVKAIVSPKS